MYLTHYGLSTKPFSMSPDSKFLWLGENHKEALATLEYGIMGEKGFLILTGEVGTGKTILINALIDHVDKDVVLACGTARVVWLRTTMYPALATW